MSMEIGLYGLGRMGGNMVTRLASGGHRVVAGNRSRGPGGEGAGPGARAGGERGAPPGGGWAWAGEPRLEGRRDRRRRELVLPGLDAAGRGAVGEGPALRRRRRGEIGRGHVRTPGTGKPPR